jgi:hypothetical protein
MAHVNTACETARETYGRSEPTTPTPDEPLSRRTRSIRYGGSIFLVLVGVGCGALIRGTAGGTLATVFVGLGLIGVVSLLFYEVGLTEDRDRERSAQGRLADLHGQAAGGASPAGAGEQPDAEPGSDGSPSQPQADAHSPGRPPRHRPPDRMRGRRRRLR